MIQQDFFNITFGNMTLYSNVMMHVRLRRGEMNCWAFTVHPHPRLGVGVEGLFRAMFPGM